MHRGVQSNDWIVMKRAYYQRFILYFEFKMKKKLILITWFHIMIRNYGIMEYRQLLQKAQEIMACSILHQMISLRRTF